MVSFFNLIILNVEIFDKNLINLNCLFSSYKTKKSFALEKK